MEASSKDSTSMFRIWGLEEQLRGHGEKREPAATPRVLHAFQSPFIIADRSSPATDISSSGSIIIASGQLFVRRKSNRRLSQRCLKLTEGLNESSSLFGRRVSVPFSDEKTMR